MNIDDLKKMSTVERLQAMEALWDSMQYENDKIDTPKWHEGGWLRLQLQHDLWQTQQKVDLKNLKRVKAA